MTSPSSSTDRGLPRDRLRELLDAVLVEENLTLGAMADTAFSSRFHFARTLSAEAGEAPVALRRRVMLERAAWRLARGASVTEIALEAGYDSPDGFGRAYARAYGHAPSARPPGTPHRLPAPNGVHFHPPMHLWVTSDPLAAGAGDRGLGVTALQVHHDVADTAALIDLAAMLPEDLVVRPLRPDQVVLEWDGPEASVVDVLAATVWTKEVWLASIEGLDEPVRGVRDLAGLRAHHDEVAARWLAMVHAAETDGAWDDRVVDALCDPPESFVLGGIVAHVLTFASHRRQLVRAMLRELGATVPSDVGAGDPLDWLARRSTP